MPVAERIDFSDELLIGASEKQIKEYINKMVGHGIKQNLIDMSTHCDIKSIFAKLTEEEKEEIAGEIIGEELSEEKRKQFILKIVKYAKEKGLITNKEIVKDIGFFDFIGAKF